MKEFQSPGAFARYLATLEARLPAARKKGLEAAAEMLKKEIQDEIGTYQDAVHGLPAWAELAERTVNERTGKGYSPNEPLFRTGELRATISYIVHDDHAVVGSPDPIMVYQEFGTPDAAHPIPPRPVIGGSLFRKADKIVEAMILPTIRVLEGKL